MSLCGSAILTFAAARTDANSYKRPWVLVLLAVMLCSYGYGAGMEINAGLDGAPTQRFPVKVLAKHISSGKGRARHVIIAAWGPKRGPDDVTVGGGFYRAVNVGDTLCVDLHSGALGVPWYRLTDCPGQSY
jgi:hypothetical protein